MAWYKDQSGKPVWVDDTPKPVIGAKPDPTLPYQAGQAAADLTGRNASNARTIQQTEQDRQLFDSQRRAADADADLKELNLQKARELAESQSPLNTRQLQDVEANAMSKLRTIDNIRKTTRNAWLPAVGTGAETLAGIGGTSAADVAADVDTLKAGSALSEILKMTQQTGKNPFTPMSNSDVELIARNTGNLTQRQTPSNFDRNLSEYQGAYTRAYAGAVGQRTLGQEIERHLPNIPPAKRDAFKLDALRRYNERMARDGGRGLLGSQRRAQRPAASSGWGKVEVSD